MGGFHTDKPLLLVIIFVFATKTFCLGLQNIFYSTLNFVRIRIDLMQIRIQHVWFIRIRIDSVNLTPTFFM